MPIKFACPAGHLLNVADRLAGREVRCLHCGTMVPVPLASTPAARQDPVTAPPAIEPPPLDAAVIEPEQIPGGLTQPRSPQTPALDAAVIEVEEIPGGLTPGRSPEIPPVAAPPLPPAPIPAPPPPPPPSLPGYECPARERNAVLGVACALGAVAFSLAAPAFYEIAEHMGAATSSGVARWAFALLALAALHISYAIYVWQVPDWASVFVVAIIELGHAMLLAFALGLLLASKTELALAQWFDLADAARSDLARLWCFFALALSSAVAFLSGRYGLAWRKRLAA